MKSRIFWGVTMIVLAVALILSALGFNFWLPEGIATWQLILTALCLLWIVHSCVYKHFSQLFFPSIFVVMIFESEIAGALNIASGDLAPTWLFILIAVLLTVGSQLLFSHGVVVMHDTDGNEVKVNKGRVTGSSVLYIDCGEQFNERIENNLGSCSVYFSNKEQFVSGSILAVENNLGSLVLHVPDEWVVTTTIENNLGSIKADGDAERTGEKVLRITGENNLGSIVIKRV
jgi:predicted membrane protein